MVIRLAALAAAALLGTGSATMPCNCEVETISCLDGVASFPAATCAEAPLPPPPHVTQAKLACPPGETAISAGFRVVAGRLRPLLEMSPVAPSGGHATSYLFAWRTAGGTDIRVYITCERLA